VQEETFVRLKIRSTRRSPDEIGSELGLAADEQWQAGGFRPRTKMVAKTNGWILDSGKPRDATLDEHLEALLARLRGHEDRIRAISSSDSVEVSCVLYSIREPALNFSPELLARITELGAGLDIDLYVWKTSEQESD
jgi:hypothetical protein